MWALTDSSLTLTIGHQLSLTSSPTNTRNAQFQVPAGTAANESLTSRTVRISILLGLFWPLSLLLVVIFVCDERCAAGFATLYLTFQPSTLILSFPTSKAAHLANSSIAVKAPFLFLFLFLFIQSLTKLVLDNAPLSAVSILRLRWVRSFILARFFTPFRPY